MVTFRLTGPDDLPRVQAFYRTWNYQGPVAATQRVFVAEIDREIVGIVRLVEEDGVVVLRGMRVDAAHQRRRIGRGLLDAVAASIGSRLCYCIAYSHLRRFYGEIGFVEPRPADVPAFLGARLDAYRATRPEEFCVLCRPAGSAEHTR